MMTGVEISAKLSEELSQVVVLHTRVIGRFLEILPSPHVPTPF